jgi:hypothetical protein
MSADRPLKCTVMFLGRVMSKQVVLTKMGAHQFTTAPSGCGLSSNDIKIEEFLKASRSYSGFTLTSILIEKDVGFSVPKPTYIGMKGISGPKIAGYSLLNSRYVVGITDQTITPWDIVDALHAAIAFITGSVAENIIPIAFDPIKGSTCNTYSQKRFRAMIAATLPCSPNDTQYSEHAGAFAYESDIDLLIWRVAEVILSNRRSIYSLLFYREALQSYANIERLDSYKLPAADERPLSISESVKLENSIHNFYKTIEGMYGGTLPKDDSKIVSKFSDYSIDLTQEAAAFGISRGAGSLMTAVRKLQKARDDRAAHGRVHSNRVGTYFEIIESKKLVRGLLRAYLHFKSGSDPLKIIVPEASFGK